MKNLKLLLLVLVFSIFSFKTNEEDNRLFKSRILLNNLINDAEKDGAKIIFKDVSLNSFGIWNEIYKKENFLQSENCEFEIGNKKRFESWRLFINPIIKSIKLGEFNFDINPKDDLNDLFNGYLLKDFNLIKCEKEDITKNILSGKIETTFFLNKDNKYIKVPAIFNFGEKNNFNLNLLFVFNKKHKLDFITCLNDNKGFCSLIQKGSNNDFVYEITYNLTLKLFDEKVLDGKVFFKNIIKQNKDGKRENIEFIDINNIKTK